MLNQDLGEGVEGGRGTGGEEEGFQGAVAGG